MSDASDPTEKQGPPSPRTPRAQRRIWPTQKVIMVCFWGFIFLCVAIGVGVGVGVGVGAKKKHNDSPATTAGASAGEASASGGTGASPAGETKEVAREELLGDQARWLGSARRFPAGAPPTTREFNWTVSAVRGAPGGLAKPMVVVNGISPGPVLEANEGDLLRIHVHNALENATSIHWHGQLLPGRGFMDGTHGITQCGIPPGVSFTYEWTAEQGTSWYHAHSGGQYTDGLVGAIVFHPRPSGSGVGGSAPQAEGNEPGIEAQYDDEVTLMLSDMYNTAAPALAWRFTALGTGIDGQPGDEPTPDGGSINGVSQAACAYVPESDLVIPERRRSLHAVPPQSPGARRSYTHGTHYAATNECGGVPTTHWNMTLEQGKTYRLRLINAGSFVNTVFSVDGHALTVVEADGVAIRPFRASSVELAVGQRYSALLTLDRPPAAYWVRNQLQTSEIRYTSPNFSETTLAVLRYAGVDAAALPDAAEGGGGDASGTGSAHGLPRLNPDSKLTPVHGPDAPQGREQQHSVQFNMQYTADNGHYMFFNDSSWEPVAGGADIFKIRADPSFASVAGAQDGAGDQVNIVTLGPSASRANGTSGSAGSAGGNATSAESAGAGAGFMDLIVNSLDDGAHPFHLHGHRFWVLSAGPGHFVGDSSALSAAGAMRRDTLQIPSYGHAVLRLGTRNAGVWAFHCHIAWHMQLGLLMTLTHRPDEIRAWALPDGFEAMCADERQPAADSGAGGMGQ